MRESEKRDQKKRTIQRAKLRAEHSKRRRRLVKERERQRIVKLLLNCQRKNREKEKTHNKCLREAEEARREANEKKWMEREIYQEWLLTIEKFILEYAEGEAKRNIKKYMKNVEGQRERMRSNNGYNRNR
ncbi:stress response protein NST1-like [Fopius arisanus]|uniref:Stress response protein NST1-like n=1 Tax=Fopius arisanus TaxID=64838 RepID=A0A9R1T4F2_9HYME|nr:PREDICTED: stress response protein NST1-like [Fopius arisanus]